ncbi:ArdC family protein [Methanofollis ethanolicus]|uniref:ArdC family protein n=1 Tax=Methanofollis ethanolicus TaxID=488124 RepID=UPI00082B27B1|nr:zincin-like metallopeptidase domain-containing protein [Methanofollis ethanolicus]
MVSVYEMVRDRIISSLESGTVPWRQTWQGMTPCNIASKRPYRGINRVLLAGATWWGTYRQIQQAGGQVRRGEKAAGLVVLWKYDEERKERDPATGEVRRVVALRDRPIVRYYRVFHLGQCDGIEPEDLAAPAPVASCDEIIRRNAPRVRAGEPAYYPARDVITMPAPARFESMAAYYAAFFHELTHWTGAAHRLDREGITGAVRFGSERYSREELTAEMGAAFLCATTGTDTPPVAENQAAYVAGWLRHIREGTAADVVRAASDAQKAADWITGGPAPASSLGTPASGPGVLPAGRC